MVKYECRICRIKVDKDFCLDFGFICNKCDQIVDEVKKIIISYGFLDDNKLIAEILKNISIWFSKSYIK